MILKVSVINLYKYFSIKRKQCLFRIKILNDTIQYVVNDPTC